MGGKSSDSLINSAVVRAVGKAKIVPYVREVRSIRAVYFDELRVVSEKVRFVDNGSGMQEAVNAWAVFETNCPLFD